MSAPNFKYGKFILPVEDTSGKVDKVTGSSLVPDTQISKIHSQNTDSVLLSPNGLHSATLDNAGVLTVQQIAYTGNPVVVHAQEVYSTNDQIILRDGAVSGLANGAYAGFTAKLYDGVHDGQLVFDNLGFARVGDVGSLVKLAAIQETPTGGQFTYYDDVNYILKTRAFSSGDITTALGFTPVSGTPWTSMGYLTSITGLQVTTALGFTPLATRSFGTAANNNTSDFEVPLTFSTGLTRTGNTITNNITQYTNAMAVSAQSTAGTSTTGLLSSTDWNTFNGKQNALGFTPYNATNPSSFITISSVPVVAITVPLISGVATIGTSGKWADGSHVHPVDTSLLALTGGTMTGGITNSTSINPFTTLAESWIGPSSTTGIYFKAGNVGIGITTPIAPLSVLAASTGYSSDSQIKISDRSTSYYGGLSFDDAGSTKLSIRNSYDGNGSIIGFGFGGSSDKVQIIDGTGLIVNSGNVGIGITTPTAVLHLKAGTAAAGTAPLKFTTGVLLTTLELGAVEFMDDGTNGHLYITKNLSGVLIRTLIV